MRIVLFAHPRFLPSMSMPRFANMILRGMRARGHDIHVWDPMPLFIHSLPPRSEEVAGLCRSVPRVPDSGSAAPSENRRGHAIRFADQALGPWVPLVASRPHVVHVHDFIALRSALGEFPDHPTSWTGRQYQAMIRRGFSEAQQFISVSKTLERICIGS